jgi:hypothetical protein
LGTNTDPETSCALPSIPDVDWYTTRAAKEVTLMIRRSTFANVTAELNVPGPEPERSTSTGTPGMLDPLLVGGGGGVRC